MDAENNCRWTLWVRIRQVYNTDPQRRCYNGVNFSEETRWTGWSEVCTYREKPTAEQTAVDFAKINPHRQYKVEKEVT